MWQEILLFRSVIKYKGVRRPQEQDRLSSRLHLVSMENVGQALSDLILYI